MDLGRGADIEYDTGRHVGVLAGCVRRENYCELLRCAVVCCGANADICIYIAGSEEEGYGVDRVIPQIA